MATDRTDDLFTKIGCVLAFSLSLGLFFIGVDYMLSHIGKPIQVFSGSIVGYIGWLVFTNLFEDTFRVLREFAAFSLRLMKEVARMLVRGMRR